MTSPQQQNVTSLPGISEYFNGKSVAITGATGFIGHCLIEKLLRSCPGVVKIYLLIRQKKDDSAEERLNKLTQLQVFDTLRALQPNFADKLVAVPCDLEKEGFNLTDEWETKITNEVNIFFHSAATLRFNEHIRLSYQINTLAVRTMLGLCRKIKNLESLVHISTAYSFCDRKDIGDEVYKTGWNFDKLHSAMQWMNDDMLTKLTPDILRTRPNTYTLTKAFGEELVVKEGQGLPLCIVRPSIVGATHAEPVAGWCSNFNGATGLFIAYGKGLLRSFYVKADNCMDIIPADLVVNGMVAAAWRNAVCGESPNSPSIAATPLIDRRSDSAFSSASDLAELQTLGRVREEESPEMELRRRTIPIYNLVASSTNPIPLNRWNNIMSTSYDNYPLDAFMSPDLNIVSSKLVYRIMFFFKQYIPAYIFDAGLILMGRKPMLLRWTQRVTGTIGVLQYFVTNQWNWDNSSLVQLQRLMSENDRKMFNFDASVIDWEQYMDSYAKGTKKYLLKEDPMNYPAARRRIQRLRILGYCSQCLVFMAVWRLLVPRSAIAKNLWHLFMSLWFKFLRFFQISSTLHRSSFFSRIFSSVSSS
uniref:Fatty acyl-CoA reductase n=1 Tax=Ciona savignyi TaxID=51511 RepID=H2Y506_CIOSA